MEIFFFTLIIFFLQIWYIYHSYRKGVCLYIIVYFIYSILIFLPFYFIYLDIHGYVDIQDIVGRSVDAKTVLDVGDGTKPLILGIIFSINYLFVGESLKSNNINYRSYIPLILPKSWLTKFIFPIFFISVAYTMLRHYVVPDFPLFSVVSGDNLRDVAFYYGSSTSAPWIFLPSINSQFYRIAMPFVFFFLLYVVKLSPKKPKTTIYILLIISGLLMVVLNFGTFKRTPILYLLVWLFVFFNGYQKIKIGKSFRYIGVIFGLLILITMYYSHNTSSVLSNLMARFLIGEAIGEFLAVEHFGSTFDYMIFDIPYKYLQKVAGQDVMTFSQEWKIRVGGSRGYTSIGIVAELYASFGWWSVLLFAPFTLLILKLDKAFKIYRNTAYWPVLSGVIVVLSFMMIKGFFAQLFTGGVITLSLIYFWQKLILKN